MSAAVVMGLSAVGLVVAESNESSTKLPADSQTPVGLHLIQSDQTGLVLELQTPAYSVQADRSGYQQIHSAGLLTLSVAGQPQLPFASALIGVPPDAKVTVKVVEDEAVPLAGQFDLPPAPSPVASDLVAGRMTVTVDAWTYNQTALYPSQTARLADEAWVRDQRLVRIEVYPFQYNPRTKQIVWHRNVRVAVRFERGAAQALKAAPSDSGLNPFEATLKDVLLNYEQARQWRVAPEVYGAVPQLLDRQTTAAASPSSTTTEYKIVVNQDGLYQLTYTDLLSAGLDVTGVVPSNFRLTSQGRNVAIEVVGEADGHFDPGDSIIFYGQKLRGDILAARFASEDDHWLMFNTGWQARLTPFMIERYTDDNVYWLTTAGPAGPRMSAVNGTPSGTAMVPDYFTATVHAEQSNVWRTITFTGEDPFFWELVSASSRLTRTYNITLTDIATPAVSATVRGDIVGWTYASANPDHHTLFYMNAQSAPLQDVYWDGANRYRFNGQVAATDLVSGVNQLKFVISPTAALPTDQIYFDWFEVDYARRFAAQSDQLSFTDRGTGSREFRVSGLSTNAVRVLDISDPYLPRRVTSPTLSGSSGVYTAAFEINQSVPMTYFVATNAGLQSVESISPYVPIDLSGGTGADYLIITHRAFYTGVQPLADFRAAQGLRVKVIDVDDVYNQYTDGIFQPLAIKAFLADAYANWPKPAPAYVLLVGDGHWNFKNYTVSTGQGQVLNSPPIYMPPNLEWVDPFQGEVDSTNMLAAVAGTDIFPDLAIGRLPVNNLTELSTVVNKIIAYEQAGVQPYQDRVTFVADNTPDPKGAGDFIASSESVINYYLPPVYGVDRVYENNFGCVSFATCPAVNYALTRTINLTGALIVNYTGHGAIPNWADERIFTNNDIPTLDNANQLPIILSMTCLDGYWLHPRATTHSSLAELNLRAANGGAIAAFSPTGLGVAEGHDYLEQGFFTAVFSDGQQYLGPATIAAKLALYATGAHDDLIHTFTLFGDPALKLPTYALSLSPGSSLTGKGAPGTAVAYTLRVTNTAFMTDTLTFSMTGNHWPLTFPEISILPGSGRDVVMTVTIPLTATIGSQDSVTVTLNSHGDATRVTATLKTMAITTFDIFLPIIRRS